MDTHTIMLIAFMNKDTRFKKCLLKAWQKSKVRLNICLTCMIMTITDMNTTTLTGVMKGILKIISTKRTMAMAIAMDMVWMITKITGTRMKI